jgi:Putative Ig domain
MAVPTINPNTSVLAPFSGEVWTFQPTASNLPTAWKEAAPSFVFTANASTNVITITGVLPVDGDRFVMAAGSTLPAPLVAGAYYVARESSGNTCKLALTTGGAAIDLTTAGTGTHHLSPSSLPDGLVLSAVNGRISGTPLYWGFYEVTLIATNGDGDSAAYAFPIGVRPARALLDAAVLLEVDWSSGAVTLPQAAPLPAIKQEDGTSVVPLLALKNGDQRMLAVRFRSNGLPFNPSIAELVAGLKREDEEQLFAKTSGDFTARGSGADVLFIVKLDLTAVPTGGIKAKDVIEDFATDGPDIVLAWLELRYQYLYETSPGTVELLSLASQSFPVALERSLLA